VRIQRLLGPIYGQRRILSSLIASQHSSSLSVPLRFSKIAKVSLVLTERCYLDFTTRRA
jgi:hypothetical protein